eukprot:ANDGO_06801.mRNA.1 Chaperone protein DnaJ
MIRFRAVLCVFLIVLSVFAGCAIGSDDYYAVLGVSKSATPAQIKRAFRALSLKYHPDRVQDHRHKENFKKKYQLIVEAYETLSDESKRRDYDNPSFKSSSSQHESFYTHPHQSFRWPFGHGNAFFRSSASNAQQSFPSVDVRYSTVSSTASALTFASSDSVVFFIATFPGLIPPMMWSQIVQHWDAVARLFKDVPHMKFFHLQLLDYREWSELAAMRKVPSTPFASVFLGGDFKVPELCTVLYPVFPDDRFVKDCVANALRSFVYLDVAHAIRDANAHKKSLVVTGSTRSQIAVSEYIAAFMYSEKVVYVRKEVLSSAKLYSSLRSLIPLPSELEQHRTPVSVIYLYPCYAFGSNVSVRDLGCVHTQFPKQASGLDLVLARASVSLIQPLSEQSVEAAARKRGRMMILLTDIIDSVLSASSQWALLAEALRVSQKRQIPLFLASSCDSSKNRRFLSLFPASITCGIGWPGAKLYYSFLPLPSNVYSSTNLLIVDFSHKHRVSAIPVSADGLIDFRSEKSVPISDKAMSVAIADDINEEQSQNKWLRRVIHAPFQMYRFIKGLVSGAPVDVTTDDDDHDVPSPFWVSASTILMSPTVIFALLTIFILAQF